MTMRPVPILRPPSAPGITAPQPLHRKERKVLYIVDPNTGKDIISDVMSTRSTPPASTGSGSRGFNSNEIIERQYYQNDGKCGTCGDPYDGERKNEAGGIYATGFIARRYEKGQDIEVEIQLTANHLGSFVFKICPNNDVTTQVSQECLDQNVLELAGQPGVTRYEPGSNIGSHYVKLALPADMTCEQCVLQWHYTAGNNYNGPQETFINCADVAIDDDSNPINPTPATSRPPTTTTTKSTTQRPLTTTKKQTTTKPTTTSAPSTSKPTTKVPSTTTTPSSGHVTSCEADEIIDCIGVGVFAGIGYERWCNTYCGYQHAACSPDLCQCSCIPKATCRAIGGYETIPGMDKYCEDACQYGCNHLSNMCSCD
ncbi:unnamed protein product [Mytilus edulis]|uniref:Chitin-binding type-4 domain-containing protein n=1 Tax=Mytilus edulis TaxID=6550 RepID=A0A8S3U1Z0_MYTED|nr:unnamed protein product [Mytilus edulis]